MELIQESKFNTTNATFKAYDNGLIEMSYGRSTLSDDENNAETKWTVENYNIVQEKYPDMKFYVLFDFRNIENVEGTTGFSLKEYARMLKDPKTLKVATYGQTTAFATIISVINKLSKTLGKLKVFDSRKEAIEWLGVEDYK